MNYMNTILHGDALGMLKQIPDNSVDLLTTDPPYGITFMGRAWDKALPDIGIFRETLRVLKPGAFAFVMSAPRSDVCSRMAILLEEAGFNIAFTPIYWTYASGFPKAMNIGKMVDKRRGCDISFYLKTTTLSDKQIADHCDVDNRLVKFWRDNERQIMYPEWIKLKNLLGVENSEIDDALTPEKREITGEKIDPDGKLKSKRLVNIAKNATSWNLLDTEERLEKAKYNTAPATDQAKALDGSYGGFQPKPAVEVIIVAMKPLSEKTYVDQALKNGKGITWLDDCRIPTNGDTSNERKSKYGSTTAFASGQQLGEFDMAQGRFPANLLISDDVLNDGVERKSGGTTQYSNKGQPWNGTKMGSVAYDRQMPGGSGSYSRYFDLDAWYNQNIWNKTATANATQTSHSGTQKGCAVPEQIKKTLPFLAVPKASKSEKLGTKHPTTKPLKLMAYLITLASRPGDTVLDPFAGSGTTCVAAKQLGRNFIGIEREREYCDMAELRLSAVQPTLLTQPTVENKV